MDIPLLNPNSTFLPNSYTLPLTFSSTVAMTVATHDVTKTDDVLAAYTDK